MSSTCENNNMPQVYPITVDETFKKQIEDIVKEQVVKAIQFQREQVYLAMKQSEIVNNNFMCELNYSQKTAKMIVPKDLILGLAVIGAGCWLANLCMSK